MRRDAHPRHSLKHLFVLWLMALRHATNTAPISNLIFISPFASLVLLNLLINAARSATVEVRDHSR